MQNKEEIKIFVNQVYYITVTRNMSFKEILNYFMSFLHDELGDFYTMNEETILLETSSMQICNLTDTLSNLNVQEGMHFYLF